MQIKDVIDKTQLSKKAIRYYENCGLIETTKKGNGYKDYSDANVHKLTSVKKFRELGFSTDEIKEFYESEPKRKAVLTEKMKNNEKLMATQNKVKEILTDLSNGKSIEQTDTSEIETRSETPYMLIKNVYLVFGVISLISFMLIFTYFIFLKEPAHHDLGLLIVAQCVVIGFYTKLLGDRKKLKAEGLQDLERKPKEMLYRFLVILLTFGMAGAMVNECIYGAKMYLDLGKSFNVFGNIGLGIGFILFSLVVVFISFFEEFEDIARLFKKPE